MPSHQSRIFVRALSYFRDRAEGLVAVVADGLSNALDQVRTWHPAYQDASDAAIQQSTFTAQDAQLVYARQHGFDSWSAFATYLRKLPATAGHEPFLTAFEAGRRGEWEIAHGSGGTSLAVALFWGHRQVVTPLAAAAIAPANLRIAAGIGRPDLVEACFHADGTLTDIAMAGRDFYRPHGGFPSWRPTQDRQEILDEALVWAAKSDRVEVMDALLTLGAMIDAEPYRGMALVWAAANDRVKALEWLLDHGADVNKRTTFGGLTHGNRVTALHLAAQGNKVGAVRCLLARGADRTITDATYGGTPRGWAEHDGAKEAVSVLSS